MYFCLNMIPALPKEYFPFSTNQTSLPVLVHNNLDNMLCVPDTVQTTPVESKRQQNKERRASDSISIDLGQLYVVKYLKHQFIKEKGLGVLTREVMVLSVSQHQHVMYLSL